MIEKVRTLVNELMAGNDNGHGCDHVDRVYKLAIKFAKQEKANMEVVSLAALLHDVDDYKIVGMENSVKLLNAKEIMSKFNVKKDVQEQVLKIISSMGYNKYLSDIRPTTLEGAVVSDADMCDAIGANGIIRALLYAVSDKGNGRIFDKDIYPNVNITNQEYNGNTTTHDTDGFINHFFEKSLKLKNIMLTTSGEEEIIKRHNLVLDFLYQYFIEEEVPEWIEFLDNFLEKEEQLIYKKK